MLIAILTLVFAQAQDPKAPTSVAKIMEARDRALVRELDEYTRGNPKAEDLDLAYFTIFDRALEHDWYAEVEPIATRYLAEKPEGPSGPVARFTRAMTRAKSGKFADGLAEVKLLLNGMDGQEENAFATSACTTFAGTAIDAGEHGIAAQAYDALGAAFPKAEEVRFLVTEAKARLDLVGKAVPVLSACDDVQGKAVRLGEYRGKWLLLDFWSASGSHWVENLPALQTAHAKLKTQGLEILGVNMGETREEINDFVQTRKVAWRQVQGASASAETFAPLHITTLPANVLIDPSGKIVRLDVRPANLEAVLKGLLETSRK